MWGTTGGIFIYSEELKPLSYVLSQLVSGGIARTGVASAVSLVMLIVPVGVFFSWIRSRAGFLCWTAAGSCSPI